MSEADDIVKQYRTDRERIAYRQLSGPDVMILKPLDLSEQDDLGRRFEALSKTDKLKCWYRMMTLTHEANELRGEVSQSALLMPWLIVVHNVLSKHLLKVFEPYMESIRERKLEGDPEKIMRDLDQELN